MTERFRFPVRSVRSLGSAWGVLVVPISIKIVRILQIPATHKWLSDPHLILMPVVSQLLRERNFEWLPMARPIISRSKKVLSPKALSKMILYVVCRAGYRSPDFQAPTNSV